MEFLGKRLATKYPDIAIIQEIYKELRPGKEGQVGGRRQEVGDRHRRQEAAGSRSLRGRGRWREAGGQEVRRQDTRRPGG